MSTRRNLIAGFGVALGSAGIAIAPGIYGLIRPPKVPFEFGSPGPDVESTLGPAPATGTLVPTLGQTQGPFHQLNSPRRRDIRDGYPGDSTLVVRGYVLDTGGRPRAGYVLDFWQTDETARYDTAGYRYRGHQFTDRQGRYELITVSPRPYTNSGQWRTAHIHAKVQGPATSVLTTQLYLQDFADQNAIDTIYHPSLLMAESGSEGSARHLRFDFVVADV